MNTRVLGAALILTVGSAALHAPAFSTVAGPEPDGGERTDAAKTLPPVFSTIEFAKALEQNKGSDKVLVVKFTAEWCGPCKMMDKTTWRDEKVVEWVKANGVAIQVDVDRQPKVAQEYGVRAMPTMILFKKGEPVDRTVGYRDGAGMLRWMENARAGKTELDAMEEKAAAQGENVTMQERMGMARSLVQGGKFDKATREYLWLWDHMLEKEPAMTGVRLSFMASEIEDLCEQDKAAREAFAKVRDADEVRLKGEDKSWSDLADWVCLNGVLHETEKTLAWYDRIKGDPESKQTLDRFAYRLRPLLEEKGRWADVGLLVRDPQQSLRREYAMAKTRPPMPTLDPAMKKRLDEMAMESFRQQTANLYTGLLAAGRREEADEYAAAAVGRDDTVEMRLELVRRAVEEGQATEKQLEMLDAAAAKGADVTELKERVKRELGKKAG